jgi:hypothetical protein
VTKYSKEEKLLMKERHTIKGPNAKYAMNGRKNPPSEFKKEGITKTENESFGLSSAIWVLEFRKCILLAVVFRCTTHVTHHGIILDLVTWTAVSPALRLNNH